MIKNIIKTILVSISATLFISTLLSGVTYSEPALAAGPSKCMFPDTTARAVRLYGTDGNSSPCALSSCRSNNWYTSKIHHNTNPGMPSPGVVIYQAQPGAWSSLAACPTWTNTSVWTAGQ